MLERFFKLILPGVVKMCILTVFFAPTTAAGQSFQPHAVYMYSFTRYIDWPDTQGTEFVIGVLGEDSPVLPYLHQMAMKKKVDNRDIQIVTFSDPSEISDEPHMLLISQQWSQQAAVLKELMSTVGQRGCLVVSNTTPKQSLTHVNFLMESDRLIFELNKTKIENDGMKVSSELLALARIVE